MSANKEASYGGQSNHQEHKDQAAQQAEQKQQQASPQGSPSTINQAAGEVADRTAKAYDQTKQVVSQAYEKTTQVATDTYNQAMSYGKQNPGTLTLIAFGAGIGIGLLLSGGFTSRRRTSNRNRRC